MAGHLWNSTRDFFWGGNLLRINGVSLVLKVHRTHGFCFMIHSGYPVVNPWSINVKGVFLRGRRSLFQTSTKGSFCLKSFTTNFHIQHLPQNPSVFPAEIHSNVRSRWDAGETEVGHRRLGEVAQTFWRLGEVQGSTTAHISNFAGYVLMLQRFMANLLKAARLSATWKRPNLFSPAWCTGGHGHAKFWGSGCEGGTSWLGQIMGNSSGSIIWVTYIPKQIFHSRCFSIFFRRKISRSAGFACFKIRVTNFSDVSYLQARAAIETRDHTALADLMDQNFNLRRTQARSLGRAMWGYMKLEDFNPLWRVLEPGRDEDFPGGNGRGNAKFLNGISVNGAKK